MKSFLFIFLTPLTLICYEGHTLISQLQELNSHWAGKSINVFELTNTFPKTESGLIQTHLSLVEKHLRVNIPSGLTSEQQCNRQKCLDIVRDYLKENTFPKNLYHKARTPYFIDEYGTACAVGQLIIATGYKDLALQISRENNNGYISELNLIYPQIGAWANKYGFLIEELAWIQPTYPCPSSQPGTVHVTCNGGFNGYFHPDLSDLPQPCTKAWFIWYKSSWAYQGRMMYENGPCYLQAGKYKCKVIDANKMLHEYVTTITEPPPVISNISFIAPTYSCNGSFTITTSGESPPYKYYINPGIYTTSIVTNLCDSLFYITVTDKKQCYQYAAVDFRPVVGIDENYKLFTKIYPNPVSELLTVSLHEITSNSKITVCNLLGTNLKSIDKISAEETIDFSGFEKGLYFLTIESEKKKVVYRIIKQ